MPFPKNRHDEVPQVEEDFKFDPKVHLQLENPEFIKTLDFDKVAFPTDFDHELGYAAPMRIVSKEGERMLR